MEPSHKLKYESDSNHRPESLHYNALTIARSDYISVCVCVCVCVCVSVFAYECVQEGGGYVITSNKDLILIILF